MRKMLCRMILNSIRALEKRNIKADAEFIKVYEDGLASYSKYLPKEEIETYRKRLEALK